MRPYHLRIIAILCASIVFLLLTAALSTASPASSSFGLVSVGDSSQATFGGMFLSNFTSPSDLGNITQVDVYLATGGTSAKAVIYSDRNGAPDALLEHSSEVNVEGTSGTWVKFDFSYLGKPNTTYWLGVLFSSAGTYYYASGVNGKTLYSNNVTDAPSKFVGGNAASNEDLSVYAIYTSATFSAPLPNGQGGSWVQTTLLLIAVTGVIVAVFVVVVVFWKRKRGRSHGRTPLRSCGNL